MYAYIYVCQSQIPNTLLKYLALMGYVQIFLNIEYYGSNNKTHTLFFL